MDEFPGDELTRELTRRYRQHWRASRRSSPATPTRATPGLERVATAVGYVEAGWWTSYGHLANLTGLFAPSFETFMFSSQVENGHRVLHTTHHRAGLHVGRPELDRRRPAGPEREGLTFDEAGRADADQRITTDMFREQLEGLGDDDEPTASCAWLVRGSSVDDRDLVPVWLYKELVSLTGANLRPITPPVPRAELKAMVDEDYQHKFYAVR